MSVSLTERLMQGDGTMPSPEPMHWRERALAERRLFVMQRQIDEAAERAAEARRLSEKLSDLLGELVVCDGPRMTLDGVTFTVQHRDRETRLYVVGQCPRCGQEALSHPIWNLHDLGRQLEDFAVDWNHRCPDRDPAPGEPTTEERLLAILRDLVDERVDHILSTRGGE